jgi:hypothetical protein
MPSALGDGESVQRRVVLTRQKLHRTGIEPVPLAFDMEGKHDNHFTIGVYNETNILHHKSCAN